MKTWMFETCRRHYSYIKTLLWKLCIVLVLITLCIERLLCRWTTRPTFLLFNASIDVNSLTSSRRSRDSGLTFPYVLTIMTHHYVFTIVYSPLCTHHYVLTIMYSLLCTHHYVLTITYSSLCTHHYVLIWVEAKLLYEGLSFNKLRIYLYVKALFYDLSWQSGKFQF